MVPSASTASRPATLGSHRAITQRQRAPGVGGDHAANRGAAARCQVHRHIQPDQPGALLRRLKGHARADSELPGVEVDLVNLHQPGGVEHHLAVERSRTADQTCVPALHDDASGLRARSSARACAT